MINTGNGLVFQQQFYELHFQHTQLAVSNDQKVATATGRIKKTKVTYFFMKLFKFVAIAFYAFKFFPQLIEKQRLYHLHNIFLAGIMSAKVSSFFGVHHTLKQRTKNSGRNFTPIQPATIQQQFSHFAVETGNGQMLFKQFSVYIRKGGEAFIQIGKSLAGGVLSTSNNWAIWLARSLPSTFGALINIIIQNAAFKNVGIICEKAKQQPHEIQFQRMAFVTDGFQFVVQLTHQRGSFNIYRILLTKSSFFITGYKTKQADMIYQFSI